MRSPQAWRRWPGTTAFLMCSFVATAALSDVATAQEIAPEAADAAEQETKTRPLPTPAPPTGEPASPSAISEQSDAAVEETLRAAYGQIDDLAGVKVGVASGVVTLRGEVERPARREEAEAIARNLAGVLFVNNDVEVVPGARATDSEQPSAQDEAIEQRLEAIYGSIEDLSQVEVAVSSGVVQLTGTVPGIEAANQATKLAEGFEGVVYVDDDTVEETSIAKRLQPALAEFVDLLETLIIYLPLTLVGLIILAIFWYVARKVSSADFLFHRLSAQPLARSMLRRLTRTVIFLAGVLLVLEVFHVTALVGAILGGVGVAGIALGLAFRSIGENYLASVSLSLSRPFDRHDHVRIEDYEGKVIRLTTRETLLMTLAGNHVRIPNSLVYTSAIENYTRNPKRRLQVDVDVGATEDLLRVRELGVDALCAMEPVLADPPPFARLERLGGAEVSVRFFAWIDQTHHHFLNTQSEARYHILNALADGEVEMPEPTYRVNLYRHPSASPGDRTRLTFQDRDTGSVINLDATTEIDLQISEDQRRSDERDLMD